MAKVCIIGAGSWGSALASTIADKTGSAIIIGRHQAICEEINNFHTNNSYLSGVQLHNKVRATTEFNEAINCDYIVIAVPSRSFSEVITKLQILNLRNVGIIIATKGLLNNTLFSDNINFVSNVAVISGPNFASDVAFKSKTLITVASKDLQFAHKASIIFPEYILLECTDDIVAVQVFGFMKNIIAIMCGLLKGLGYSGNTIASIVGLGSYEIHLLSSALGSKNTCPAGSVGDLFLTCLSEASRNFRFGLGLSKDEVNNNANYLVEGVGVLNAVLEISHRLGIVLHTSNALAEIIKNPAQAKTVLDILFKNYQIIY